MRMRFPGVVLSLVAVTLIAGAPSSTRAADNETPQVAASKADCTFDASAPRTPREMWKKVTDDITAYDRSRWGAPVVNADAKPPKRRAYVPSPPPKYESKNFIDDEIFGKMAKAGVRWAPPASDAEFLRRAYLDLTGQIPELEVARSFLADTDPNKREKLIDRLLTTEGYVDRWALWFGDLVQNTSLATNTNMTAAMRNNFYDYMRTAFGENRPYDQMVREIISGSGSFAAKFEVNYILRWRQDNGPPQDFFDNLAADTTEKFLGIPMNCLSCHNGIGHLEQVNLGMSKRTRMEFWKTAAFFAQLSARPQGAPAEFAVTDVAGGSYRLNTDSGNKTPRTPPSGSATNTVSPAFMFSGEGPAAGEPPRTAYARQLTAHPQFARTAVNRIWKEMFGLGIVEPLDSFDLLRQDPATISPGLTLQPSHPELLTKLANEFTAHNYDLRALLKTIMMSNAYQLSSRYTTAVWSEEYTPYFARRYPRRILAEGILDAIIRATNAGMSFPSSYRVPITRAMALPDPAEPFDRFIGPFLKSFDRGDRDGTFRGRDSSIIQVLNLVNDPIVTQRVKNAQTNRVRETLNATRDPEKIVSELYLATLSRYPTTNELKIAADYLRNGDIIKNTEDLHFALINRLEFLYN